MMHPRIEEAVEALRAIGWKVEPAPQPRPLPEHVVKRHPDLPPLAVEFFTNVNSCVGPDEEFWLLAAEDFARTGSDAFRWDEFERIFTEGEGSDEEGAQEARDFWDRYLPIFQLVSGDYEFLAIGTDPTAKHFGKVVWGDLSLARDEDPGVNADSYEDFLVQLRDVARRDPARRSEADITLSRLIDPDFEGYDPEGWGARLRRWLTGGRA